MNNKDNFQSFLFEKAAVRGEIVHLSSSFKAIMELHPYPDVVKKLLGEALVVVNLLSGIIKFKGRLTLQFQGKGKLKLLLAQCNEQFHLRGLAQYDEDIKESELAEIFQQGVLVIIAEPGEETGTRYQGIVSWEHSLAKSVENYFKHSEQIPTRLWLAVNDSKAAGFLLQVLPKESDANIQDDWEHISHLTNTITEEELLDLENETLLHRLYSEEDVRLFKPVPVEFRCTCSPERGEVAIKMIGQKEAEEELAGNQKIVVTCEFCNKEFSYDRVDVAKIFKEGGGHSSSSTQIH